MRLRFCTLALATLFAASPLTAQTVVTGTVTGRVAGSDGAVVANAVVTLHSLQTDVTHTASTDLQGTYFIEFLTPGWYEMRVEAFGYRPMVVTNVRVEAGGRRTLDVSVNPAAPPVTQVDTVVVRGVSLGRWRGAGPLVSGKDLDAERDLLGGWTSLSRFSSALDPLLGAQGLPGMLSAQVVDGVPFFPARHPYLRGEESQSPAFPASLLGRTSVLLRPTDAHWLGSAGATLAADTKAGTGQGSKSVEGSWSGAPLWSSGTLKLGTKPSLTSYRAAANVGFDLVPDTSRLFVAGEAVRQQSPTAARMTSDQAASLDGVDPAILSKLSSPSVETISRISGLVRLDQWGDASRFTLRAAGGHLTRRYDGGEPGLMGYGIGLPEDATDLSAAASYISRTSGTVNLDFLGGVSLSDRTYGAAAALPAAMLVGPGLPVGQAAGSPAKVSRVDLYLSPGLDLSFGPGIGKVGLDVQATSHTYDQAFEGGGDLFFSDGAALVDSTGVYADGISRKSSFTTGRFGGFAQYVWDPAPGLHVTAGGRVDWETVPKSDVTLNTDWATASGTTNKQFPARLMQPGGVVAATWDLRGEGHTVVFAGGSLTNGTLDPALIHEAIAQDGDATVQRYVGNGVPWPSMSGAPAGARSAAVLTLLGPDTRAPRTTEVSGGLVQALGAGWTVHVSAAFRRTDFLPRRRDVNLSVFPTAIDAYGRGVYGNLQEIGSLVAADPGSNRRFPGFDAVWAVDPDGWSKYQGESVGLEYAAGRTDAFVSYTHSRTTDNWVGAAKGLPDATLDPHFPVKAGAAPWAEATSDFDVPDRLVAGARVHLDVGRGAEISATYTYQSGLPFTPGYRVGVDANGDGSARNDVAFVPDASTLGSLAGSWSCLADQAGDFAARNSCRGPSSSTLNAGVRFGFAGLGGRTLYLTVEGFNLAEDKSGVVDSALLLVDPTKPIQVSADGSTVTVPVTVNPSFGKVVLPATRGRILRIGLRLGG
jgi:hypothetical protein